MRELNVNEIKQVNGGVLPLGYAAALYLAGQAGNVWAWYSFAKSMK
tara:strand:+ start:1517 stop:1654 length:138 start_codon:yes stop_codon:yes gene_type:complete